MRFVCVVLAAMALAAISSSESAAVPMEERQAIREVVLDYAEGYYGGEPMRMTRAVSTYLSKRGLMGPPGVTPFLLEMNAEMLIEASHGAKIAAADRRITSEVLHVNTEVASARVFTAKFNDYLHLVKRNGSWQILNVLWHAPPPTGTPEGATEAVERAVRAYHAACLAGDGAGALMVLHPVAHLRTFATAPQGRPRVIREQNAESIAAAFASGQMQLRGRPEAAQIVVDGVDVDIASARLAVGDTLTYLHLARQAGKWRVVNALTYSPPAVVGHPPAGPALEEARTIGWVAVVMNSFGVTSPRL